MTTNKSRQAAHRAKMAAAGLVQCNVWVPAGAVHEIQRAAELMRANPDLVVARLVDVTTGRLCGLRHGPAKPAPVAMPARPAAELAPAADASADAGLDVAGRASVAGPAWPMASRV